MNGRTHTHKHTCKQERWGGKSRFLVNIPREERMRGTQRFYLGVSTIAQLHLAAWIGDGEKSEMGEHEKRKKNTVKRK